MCKGKQAKRRSSIKLMHNIHLKSYKLDEYYAIDMDSLHRFCKIK